MSAMVMLACASLSFLTARGASAASPGKIYFFASRIACAASGAFTERECAAAFANAREQLRDRAPRFSSAGDCRLRFRMCETSRSESGQGDAMAYAASESVAFTPLALGVEMTASAKGVLAAPTLAVDTPTRLFPYFPVSRPYEARDREPARSAQTETNAAILSADRFEPFSKRKPVAGASSFTVTVLGAIEGATQRDAASETSEERRARLKSAPFVD
jgi:hypothetical protein